MARSKEFDETVVLKKAMELFWEQGYEKTSMQDLVDRMGIHRRSIYDTFGDKRSLFLAALDEYEKFIKHEMETISDVFLFILRSSDQYPKGCLSVNAAVELSLLDQEIDQLVTAMFNRTEGMFEELIRHGQQNGELSGEIDPVQTARFLHNNLIGLRVLIKTNYSQKELESIITLALKVLD